METTDYKDRAFSTWLEFVHNPSGSHRPWQRCSQDFNATDYTDSTCLHRPHKNFNHFCAFPSDYVSLQYIQEISFFAKTHKMKKSVDLI